MEPWEIWVRSTELHAFVHRYEPHLWPALQTIHYFGLCLLVGTVGLFDLRVLGLARAIPPGALHRLIRWGIAGFAINLLTGIVFFSGHPEQYAYNQAFAFKATFMAIAGMNILAFYGTRAFAEVKAAPPGADLDFRIKLIAGTSLAMWIAVLVCGRLITFFRPPFFH